MKPSITASPTIQPQNTKFKVLSANQVEPLNAYFLALVNFSQPRYQGDASISSAVATMFTPAFLAADSIGTCDLLNPRLASCATVHRSTSVSFNALIAAGLSLAVSLSPAATASSAPVVAPFAAAAAASASNERILDNSSNSAGSDSFVILPALFLPPAAAFSTSYQ